MTTSRGQLEALLRQALDHFREGRIRQAVSDWEQVLEADPHHQTARNFLEYTRKNQRALEAHAAGMNVPVPPPPLGLSAGADACVPPALEFEPGPGESRLASRPADAPSRLSDLSQAAAQRPGPATTLQGLPYTIPTVEIEALPPEPGQSGPEADGAAPTDGVVFAPSTSELGVPAASPGQVRSSGTMEIEALPPFDEQAPERAAEPQTGPPAPDGTQGPESEPPLFKEEELKVLSSESQGGTPFDPNARPLPPPPEKADAPAEMHLEPLDAGRSSEEFGAELQTAPPAGFPSAPAHPGPEPSPGPTYADDAPTLSRDPSARPAAAFERAVARSRSVSGEISTKAVDTGDSERKAPQVRPNGTVEGVVVSDELAVQPRPAGTREYRDDEPTTERDAWQTPRRLHAEIEAAVEADPEAALVMARELFEAGDHSHSLTAAVAVSEKLKNDPRVADLIRQNTDILANAYLQRLGSLDDVPKLTDPPKTVEPLDLDHRDVFLLSRIDGQLTLDEILLISGMGRLETLHTILRLRELGLIVLSPR